MSLITTALNSATVLFGAAATLAVLTTGFFIGRYWMRLTGDDDKDASESWSDYGARRSRQDDYDN